MICAVLILIGVPVLYGLDDYRGGGEIDSLESVFNNRGEIAIPENPDLEDYLKIAMKNNPVLKSAFYDWKAEIKRAGYAGALSDPMLSFGYYIEHVETRVGPQEYRIGLKQTIPWFGTLGAKKEAAKRAAEAAFHRFQNRELQVRYQVTREFHNLYFLARQIQITRDNFDLLEFWESVARKRYQVGLKDHPDLIKIQVELGKLEDQLQSLQAQADPAKARLRSLLGLADSVDFPLPDTAVLDEPEINPDTITARTLKFNPDLAAMSSLVDSREASMSAAGRSVMPNFTFGVDYIGTGEALNPELEESGKDPWIISAGISIPIWFGKNSAIKSEARARFRSARFNLEQARNQAVERVSQAVFEYQDALRKLRLYRDGLIPKAEEALNSIYSAYESGERDFLSLLDAQRQLLEFHLEKDRAFRNLAVSRAQIELLTGNQLDNKTNH